MFAIGSQAELTRERTVIPLSYKIDVMRGAVKSFALVLATVNAPYSQQLTAQELADCLMDHDKARPCRATCLLFSPRWRLSYKSISRVDLT
jgi:hypothetical protein